MELLLASSDLTKAKTTMQRYVSELGIGCREVVLRQAGLLKRDLVATMPPASKTSLERNIVHDASGVFAAFPRYSFPDSKRGGDHGMAWISVTKSGGLIGASNDDYNAADSAGSMNDIYRAMRGRNRQKFTSLGARGKQQVTKLNRAMARKAIFAKWLKLQLKRVGKLKASFAIDWDIYGPKGRRPQTWIMSHIDNGEARGRSEPALEGDYPSFTIVSNASGCSSQEAESAVARGIRNRVAKMIIDLRMIAQRKKLGYDE